MKNKTLEILNNLKSEINNLIKADMPTEDINNITDLSKKVDEAIQEHTNLETELHDTKEALIDTIKSTGHTSSPDDETKEDTPKSFDEIMKEELINVKKEK